MLKRLFFLVCYAILSIQAKGSFLYPIAVPVAEKEGSRYQIVIDNTEIGKNVFKPIALFFDEQNRGVFAEYDTKTNCAEFFSQYYHSKKCGNSSMFLLLHMNHYQMKRTNLLQYLKKKSLCVEPVAYNGGLLVLDKPDRRNTSKPKYIGTFYEHDSVYTSIQNGKKIVINMLLRQLGSNNLPPDRFEMLCAVHEQEKTKIFN